jgi:putative hemolysin
MSSVSLEIGAILLLILFNGVLAMAEIAIVSARKVRLQGRAAAGDRRAQAALDLANDPGRFLSTVQIGITLVGILAGTFGGATLSERLAAGFATVPLLAPYAEALAVGLVVLTITYFSLVLGELAPKQIALGNPERVAAALAPSMQRLARLTAPAVSLLAASSNLLLRFLRVKPTAQPTVTEEEIKLLLEQGAAGGVLAPVEEEMMQSVLRLADRRLTALMTPRTELDWIDLEELEDLPVLLTGSRHSYYPVVEGDLDHLLGIVKTKDLLAQQVNGGPLDLRAVLQPPLILPRSLTVLAALDRFRAQHSQVAFVIDEYGGVLGLVSTTDILAAIAGDFPDAPNAEPEIVRRADGSYLLDGLLDVDEFRRLFGLTDLPAAVDDEVQTLGGVMLNALGRVPMAGDYFEWRGLRLEVVDMDGRRVDKVLVTPPTAAA